MYVCIYVCMGKNIVYIESTVTGIHWGSWKVSPMGKGALQYLQFSNYLVIFTCVSLCMCCCLECFSSVPQLISCMNWHCWFTNTVTLWIASKLVMKVHSLLLPNCFMSNVQKYQSSQLRVSGFKLYQESSSSFGINHHYLGYNDNIFRAIIPITSLLVILYHYYCTYIVL